MLVCLISLLLILLHLSSVTVASAAVGENSAQDESTLASQTDETTNASENFTHFEFTDEQSKKVAEIEKQYFASSSDANAESILAGVSVQNLTGWDAGYIISDGMMADWGSMDETAIQSFLNGKVSSCAAGHTCLKDFWEGGHSAATIIQYAARDYSINPKALLVTLQKETGLVTDNSADAWQYRTATGFGCPDGASCDSQYYGLTNQVRHTAALYRDVLNGGWTNSKGPGLVNIQWHPNASCGAGTVNVKDRATAALYRYTPYQPNQAALNAGYGNGDGCSSYGNRNFYNYFTDWFGDTRTGGFWPEGHVDEYRVTEGNKIYVRGWALDRSDANQSIEVHIYAGVNNSKGWCGKTVANMGRPDVNDALGVPGNHGFEIICETSFADDVPVFVYGINIGSSAGLNPLIAQFNMKIPCTEVCPVYRVFNPHSGAHHFTNDANEKNVLVSQGWAFEGIPWTASKRTGKPVYRIYNAKSGEHVWTRDANEVHVRCTEGWYHESTPWYGANETTDVAVYRVFNPHSGEHIYTTDKNEVDVLSKKNGWTNEGINYYAY
jgi:hypothetical protein